MTMSRKLIIIVLVIMIVLLATVSLFFFNGEPSAPQPTNPLVQSPTTQPTATPTTAPTTVPTTQPAKPQNNGLLTDKRIYEVNDTVNFTCASLAGMNTLRVTGPNGVTQTYMNVGVSYTLKVTVPGVYVAVLETLTNEGTIESEPLQFAVIEPAVNPTTAKPATVKPTTAAPTTAAPTTAAPTTAAPTTAAPTTAAPTTAAPTTAAPTTAAPTTAAPTTAAPTTAKPTTAPTTKPTVDMNGTFYITENGKGKATVVISENYTDKTESAFTDLMDYIWRISGADLESAFDDIELEQDRFYILVGPTKYHEALGIEVPKGYPNNEKLIIQRKGNVLALIGNDDGAFTGTEYAVTRFLEELGCGWFGTQDLWNVVPENDTITIEEMNIVETPKFISRGTNRLNEGRYKSLAKRWYMGGVVTVVGGHYLASSNVLNGQQDTHPEWYAQTSSGMLMYPNNDKDVWPDIYWQYCYSNPSFQQAVAKLVMDSFAADPDCYVYSITPNDGWTFGTCQCTSCRRYSDDLSLILDFANAVARIVKQSYPERYVSLLTYHNTLVAPSGQYPVDSNLELMFCMETSMTKPASQVSYIGMSGSKVNISWKTNLENYINRTGVKQRSVWKWLCVAAEPWAENWQYIPWVQGNVATDDHAFWKDNGVSYVFYDQGPSSGYKEYESSLPLRWPLWYVANRGCWTQDKTGEQLLYDACVKLYGAGADAMMAYYRALANASAACTADSHAWAPPAATDVYTAAQVQTIDRRVAAARNMLGSVTADQAKRMKNQLDLWETAKTKF